jgi:hypothetical protein
LTTAQGDKCVKCQCHAGQTRCHSGSTQTCEDGCMWTDDENCPQDSKKCRKVGGVATCVSYPV